jgi:hypothetical protein
MTSLAQAQNLHDAGVGGFTNEEHKRITAFRVPRDEDFSKSNAFIFGPKDPTVAGYAKRWHADHRAKLASMVRAER